MWYRVALVFLLFTWQATAAQPIHSAVSVDFPNGLHAKFICYISEQLGFEADIITMPYARRLIELNDGTLDLMVGVSDAAPIGTNTVLLEPAYDSLRVGVFVLRGNESLFTEPHHLRERLLSLTRYTNSASILDNIPDEHIVPAHSIEQKIDLLLKGRIDGFIHVVPSTVRTLEQKDLTEQIVAAKLQLMAQHHQYVAINKESWLFAHKAAIEAVISKGVKNGDFTQIRLQHYDSPL